MYMYIYIYIYIYIHVQKCEGQYTMYLTLYHFVSMHVTVSLAMKRYLYIFLSRISHLSIKYARS